MVQWDAFPPASETLTAAAIINFAGGGCAWWDIPIAPSACVIPSADTTFGPSDGTVYLYFKATETENDHLRNDWVAPDGTIIIIDGGSWSISSGTYCFIYWVKPNNFEHSCKSSRCKERSWSAACMI